MTISKKIARPSSTLSDLLKAVMPAGKRASSVMDGKLQSIHGAWIPAIHAGMTVLFHNLTK